MEEGKFEKQSHIDKITIKDHSRSLDIQIPFPEKAADIIGMDVWTHLSEHPEKCTFLVTHAPPFVPRAQQRTTLLKRKSLVQKKGFQKPGDGFNIGLENI